MMAEETLHQLLKRIVDNWDKIPIRVFQDGKWQSLCLSEIKEEGDIAQWLIELFYRRRKP